MKEGAIANEAKYKAKNAALVAIDKQPPAAVRQGQGALILAALGLADRAGCEARAGPPLTAQGKGDALGLCHASP